MQIEPKQVLKIKKKILSSVKSPRHKLFVFILHNNGRQPIKSVSGYAYLYYSELSCYVSGCVKYCYSLNLGSILNKSFSFPSQRVKNYGPDLVALPGQTCSQFQVGCLVVPVPSLSQSKTQEYRKIFLSIIIFKNSIFLCQYGSITFADIT